MHTYTKQWRPHEANVTIRHHVQKLNSRSSGAPTLPSIFLHVFKVAWMQFLKEDKSSDCEPLTLFVQNVHWLIDRLHISKAAPMIWCQMKYWAVVSLHTRWLFLYGYMHYMHNRCLSLETLGSMQSMLIFVMDQKVLVICEPKRFWYNAKQSPCNNNIARVITILPVQ